MLYLLIRYSVLHNFSNCDYSAWAIMTLLHRFCINIISQEKRDSAYFVQCETCSNFTGASDVHGLGNGVGQPQRQAWTVHRHKFRISAREIAYKKS
jgi:hypothetical protein